MLICEEFEDIVKIMPDPASYQALCQKVLPTLTGAFNVADVTSDDPLITVSQAHYTSTYLLSELSIRLTRM